MSVRRHTFSLIALACVPLLSGCLAKTVANVVTAPVRVTSKAVDMATTSQSEADEKRGRAVRKREAQLGKLERNYDRHSRECAAGEEDACTQARTEYAEIQDILPTVPAQR